MFVLSLQITFGLGVTFLVSLTNSLNQLFTVVGSLFADVQSVYPGENIFDLKGTMGLWQLQVAVLLIMVLPGPLVTANITQNQQTWTMTRSQTCGRLVFSQTAILQCTWYFSFFFFGWHSDMMKMVHGEKGMRTSNIMGHFKFLLFLPSTSWMNSLSFCSLPFLA